MVAAVRVAPPRVPPEADQRVIMYDVDWRSYEVMLAVRGESDVPRMTYLEGALELMSPSRSHESIKKLIANMFEAYALRVGLVYDGYGSMTLRSGPRERGIEPDECYAIGAPKDRPDLVIEVNWTSGGLDKLAVYAGLQVREVWMWEENTIRVYVLRGETYDLAPTSALVPGIDLARMAELVARGDSQSETVRAFVDAVPPG